MAELVNRPEYLRQLIQNRDVDLVKIVTGIRRCGKSSLLELYHQYLLEQGVAESHIIHMNLESLRYRTLSDYLAFYDYVSQKIPDSGKTYLIFDELQAVSHWEKAIESFRLDYDVDIYITGSNAYLLSTEFSTLLSGRYVEIRMLPLSFKEFLTFYSFDQSVTLEEKFQKYLQFGGMPILREYQFNEARSNQALEGIYSPSSCVIFYSAMKVPIRPCFRRSCCFSAPTLAVSILPAALAMSCTTRALSKGGMSRGKPLRSISPCSAALIFSSPSAAMM